MHDLGGVPWSTTDSKSSWRKWDPSNPTLLSHWSTPQLTIHSALDYRLPISEGLAAFNILQTRGVASQFLTFPDENHFVLNPENSLVWHKVVLNWVNKHVGLPAYAEEEGKGEGLMGGVREEGMGKEEGVGVGVEVRMPSQGKPET